ncbi:MAG TPA: acyl carrier protein [Longilinea sp.]|nr:acyl carrier protein [Longilinea sp.]
MATITSELIQIFQQVFGDPAINLSPEMTADDVEGWDSLSHANLILAIENHFRIEFSRKELAGLKSVGDLTRVIESKRVK